MRALNRFFTRLLNLVTGRRGDDRLREEMESHIAAQTDQNIRAGMNPEEARRQARLQFGAVETIREQYRAEESVQIIEAFLRDMRIGVRTLMRSPELFNYCHPCNGAVYRRCHLAIYGRAVGYAEAAPIQRSGPPGDGL